MEDEREQHRAEAKKRAASSFDVAVISAVNELMALHGVAPIEYRAFAWADGQAYHLEFQVGPGDDDLRARYDRVLDVLGVPAKGVEVCGPEQEIWERLHSAIAAARRGRIR